jgi:hypothetical protein
VLLITLGYLVVQQITPLILIQVQLLVTLFWEWVAHELFLLQNV